MASFSACTEPISLIAMVPVMECRMPTLTVSSVTARPEVLTSDVGGAANDGVLNASTAGNASSPASRRRRGRDGKECFGVFMVNPSLAKCMDPREPGGSVDPR